MTPGFPVKLDVEYVDGHNWLLLKDFEYIRPNGERIVVPSGFLTDFASIPRGLWNIFPPTGEYGRAAVIHDYLYKFRQVNCPPTGGPGQSACTDPDCKFCKGHTRLCNRGEADDILVEGAKILGCGWFTRFSLHTGVRLGGWLPWKHYRKAEKGEK